MSSIEIIRVLTGLWSRLVVTLFLSFGMTITSQETWATASIYLGEQVVTSPGHFNPCNPSVSCGIIYSPTKEKQWEQSSHSIMALQTGRPTFHDFSRQSNRSRSRIFDQPNSSRRSVLETHFATSRARVTQIPSGTGDLIADVSGELDGDEDGFVFAAAVASRRHREVCSGVTPHLKRLENSSSSFSRV